MLALQVRFTEVGSLISVRFVVIDAWASCHVIQLGVASFHLHFDREQKSVRKTTISRMQTN
jgi:hypothetical protein